jgi:hypothetical protein
VEHSEIVQSRNDRILHSNEFRSCESVSPFLAYLTEKTASGEADQLKEYVIAIKGLGKPSSYDPQHNSAVHIQVGRPVYILCRPPSRALLMEWRVGMESLSLDH